MFYFLSKFYNSSFFFFQRRIVMGHESFIFIIYFFTFVGDMMCQILSYSVKTMERKNFLEGSLCRIVDPIKIFGDILLFTAFSIFFFHNHPIFYVYKKYLAPLFIFRQDNNGMAILQKENMSFAIILCLFSLIIIAITGDWFNYRIIKDAINISRNASMPP